MATLKFENRQMNILDAAENFWQKNSEENHRDRFVNLHYDLYEDNR